MTDAAPTHLVDPGATTTRCGIKLHDKRANPYPYVAAQHAQAHINGRARVGKPAPVFCPTCSDGSGLATPQPPKVDGQLGLFGEEPVA